MSETYDLERDLIGNLGLYLKGRFQKPQPLDPISKRQFQAPGIRSKAKAQLRLERKRRALEADLRQTLIIENVNTCLTTSCSDNLLGQEGCECLAQLLCLLEENVNKLFLASHFVSAGSGGFSFPSLTFEKYARLSQLVLCLKGISGESDPDTELFNLVSEINNRPPIFSIHSVPVAIQISEKATQLNKHFLRVQSQVGAKSGKRSRSPSRHTVEEGSTTSCSGDLRFRDHAAAVINALHQSLPCRSSHKVMLQLQEREGALDLLLSGCKTEDWQEVECQHYTHRNSICKIKNLCGTLQRSIDHRLQIVVEVLDTGSHKIHYSPQPASRVHTKASLAETLEDLIKGGQFKNIGFNNMSSLPRNRFSLMEKRVLAFKLGLLFLDFFDAKFMKESWNPSSIKFLVFPQKKVQDGQLYIGCSLQGTGEKEFFGPGHPVLTSFARLLLEIDEGQIWPRPNQHGGPDFATWGELCSYVEEAKRDRGPSAYLDAVTRALYLYVELNEARANREGEDVD
ncbi:hypothetical protein TWF694_004672 [Orbilia ellipsospora]|uniref:DUF7580 domain-containing protein n=1 Tax=Orbilia ellipsospora TaxID=2528407 RepID=A0AAV9WVS7_9PEZI